jgi:hypothetical protein
MLKIEDALAHLGYDVTDDVITRRVTADLDEAEAYLQGAVGMDIFDLMPEDPRVNILLKAYLDDLHDNRGTTSAKAGNAKRDMILSIETQLKVELVRVREGVGV